MVAQPVRRFACILPLLSLLLLAGCANGGDGEMDSRATSPTARATQPWDTTSAATATPTVPLVDLALSEEDVSITPLPLRAGFPFSTTVVIHNNASVVAVDVPVMFHISARQEEIGYTSFLEILTVTVPASQSVPVTMPVNWNFSGGEYQLWIQANRLPEPWQDRIPSPAEADTSDNIVLLELMVDPFDAYASDLCPGRVDVAVGPADVLPEPDRQRVLVRVHNVGNRAVYNLPVVILGEQLTGIAYTPAIPPCGGTAQVSVDVDRPFQQGEALTVRVNPGEWADGLMEDDFDNNKVAISAGMAPGTMFPPGSGLEDYDFSISNADVETPELWIVLVRVHNLGTRDAAMVPIGIENEFGRKITDAIPLVQGKGLGVAAIRAGYLWTRGGMLTFTVNPEDADGSYPETNRDNNVATFTLP